jgi:hypothetical protein
MPCPFNIDSTNELLRRVSLYAQELERKNNELLTTSKLLWERELSSRPAVRTASQPDCSPAIETQIDGDFEGWDDEVIYRMTNGQIWQQSNYHYHYHYAYRPKVVIYSTGHGCHIKVDDDSDEGVDLVRLK